MRYENPLYMAEDAGAADLIAGGRLQLGISRGSPEQVIDGWRYFGYRPAEGESDADMGRRHAEVFLDLLRGEGFAQANPRPMFPNPPGLLRLEPHLGGPARAHLVGRRLERDGGLGGQARHEPAELDAEERRDRRALPRPAGQRRSAPTARPGRRPATRASRASRSAAASSRWSTTATAPISATAARAEDQIGFIDENTRAIFGRSYAAEPDVLIEQLKADEAIAEADTLLLTVPNQLGVDYNAHVIEAILTHVAPALGWR